VILGLAFASWAQASCEQPVGSFVSITGSVDLQTSESDAWSAANLESRLCEGDTIRVGQRSRAAVSLVNDAVLRIDQNTAIRLIDITPAEQETSVLDMIRGAFQSFSRKPKFLKVNTPYLNGSVEGTEFAVRVQDEATSITVFEGVVVAANEQGEVSVRPGEAAQAAKGQAPQRRTVVRPRDQVQWALYYPPILSVADVVRSSPATERAVNCAANGNTACAFAALDEVPPSQRDAEYLLLQASVLLSVGRVDEARADINRAIERDAQASAAHALRAVIGVAQNEREAAMADARRAVELDPRSAVAKIALSYALQANLELAAARDTLLQSVEQSPDNALAWARLAELHLAEGSRRKATEAAERSAALQPGLSRTQNVLGFAALAEIKVKPAQAAFEQAIALDSADPLPRLGLGLAKIRQGMLDEGRADLEAAVALDSNNALLRAYLGKAYFEEKRGPLDADQFAVAKELDPLDPTAYFYNAIRLQTENRPVEALRELEASIERNDNRAVYRSRLLLDQDRAARGTSLARIYNDLGFDRLGINESTQSMALDPANASAHRFLSDTYRQLPRREISRVSELLQAQMLQDININPVQPSVAATNLNIVTLGGPATPGFNEFTPLFQRDEAQFNVSGFGGNNDTLGGEAVLSGVYDRLSLSAGAFSYDTDGFRPNNDLSHEIYNIYAQFAVSPQLNIQAEYDRQVTDHGDLALNFDPADFDPSFDRHFEVETGRLGARIAINPASTLLLSYIHSDREDEQRGNFAATQIPAFVPNPAFPPIPPPVFPAPPANRTTGTVSETKEKADQYEAQYLYQAEQFNFTAGLAYAEVDQDFRITDINDIANPTPGGIPPSGSFGVTVVDRPTIKDGRGYIYGNIKLPSTVTWTLGLTYQDYDEPAVEVDDVMPKFGLQWDVNPALRLRASYFEVLKPALASNRTLEPTQVAGFNQFFDDANGTDTKHYGVGADWRMKRDVYLGAELTRREIEMPVFTGAGSAVIEDRDEWYHRAYAYWTPTDRWSLSAEGIYDKYESEASVNMDRPLEVRTIRFPLRAQYFHPSGFFGAAGVTYVDQKVRRQAAATLSDGDDDFVVTDAALGYRLPSRRGVVSLVVQNLFDESFNYQDNSFRTFQDEPSVGPYVPERSVMARLTLNF
jgi:Tfp pilus assembly protein PilF